MALILANDGMDQEAVLALEKLGHQVDLQKYTGLDFLARLKEVDVIVIRSASQLKKEELEAAKGGKLKLAIRAGVGLDNIDQDYAAQVKIAVRNTPSASSNAVAEWSLGQMFSLARHFYQANRTMPAGKWLKKEYKGTEIMGKTLGLIGYGRIARCLADKALALGMKVIYTNRSGPKADAKNAEYRSLDDLLKESDFVSIHIPKAGDQAVISTKELAQMKKTAFLINAARGGVVDEVALIKALNERVIMAAASDVFVKEPSDNQELLTNPYISLSPHIGAATAEAQARIGEEIVKIVGEYSYD